MEPFRIASLLTLAFIAACARIAGPDSVVVTISDVYGEVLVHPSRLLVRSQVLDIPSRCPSGDNIALTLNLARYDQKHLLYHCSTNCYISTGEWNIVRVASDAKSHFACEDLLVVGISP
jgi:hypothetical protein